MAKLRITQTMPLNSPGILVFWCQRNSNRGAKCRWVG